ncbi:hypothetical protein BDN72DRAFT_881359 [Pluteus cervinus]|uniref:Uncharacterized protein n=1 Tax=Pluteus cervinus TaxID=181527 RepID=A0ACD3AH83_9AGAR|nr:hypothetical protein BDN72DRAFT_881359 [Pluteus cervinus]
MAGWWALLFASDALDKYLSAHSDRAIISIQFSDANFAVYFVADERICERPRTSPENGQPPGACPILLLPAEILAEIFTQVQVGESRSAASLLVMRGINRHWCAIADMTPALWSNVNIKAGQDLDAPSTFLSRSSSYPITLSISGTASTRIQTFTPEEFRAWAVKCAIILSAHIHHCRSLSIVEHWAEADTLSKLIEVLALVPAPMLQELIVTPEFTVNHPFHKLQPNIFEGGIPSVTRAQFTLTGLYHCTIPFSGITELHLGGAGDLFLSFPRFCSLVEECTQLTTLGIYNNVVEIFPQPYQRSCHLPNLLSLQIYGTMNAVSELLLCLSVPNLAELAVIPIVIEDFKLLLSRTLTEPKTLFPRVTRLFMAPTVYHSGMTEDSIYAAMTCFPNVEHLLLVNFNTKAFSYAFTSDDRGRPVPWPELRTISIRNVTEATEHTINKFLEHRATSGFPIPTIQIDPESVQVIKIRKTRPRFAYEIGDPWSGLLQHMIRSNGAGLRDLYAVVVHESDSEADN